MEGSEIWKDVVGYEGDYQVSNLGRVRSLKYGKERVLTPVIDRTGYLKINLNKNATIKKYYIHKLVAMTFLRHVPNGHSSVIDHINSDKTDNRLQNLRIVTSRENVHSYIDKIEKSSIYIGVTYDKKRGKWRAQIRISGKNKGLGRFDSELEAAQAYQNALNNL